MSRFPKRFPTPGTSPGTLQPRTELRVEEVTVTVLHYDAEQVTETAVSNVEEAFRYLDTPGVTWINVAGLHDEQMLRAFGERFGLHALVLEDVVNTGQRPKLEDHGSYCFIVMKLVEPGPAIDGEQVSIFLGRDWVLTFQEVPDRALDPVRERIRRGLGHIRELGPDYLAYALVDSLVDHFFPVLERLGERIEALETELVDNPTKKSLEKIHRIKREMLYLRRAAWPQREVINALERQETSLVREETRIFLRDCYDHTIQIMDLVESYREVTSGLMDLYLSSISNRMNEVMKVLTVMASIFIPLTFITGIYGMNFHSEASPLNMPELDWYWGYPALWLLILALSLAMVVLFRRKGWI